MNRPIFTLFQKCWKSRLCNTRNKIHRFRKKHMVEDCRAAKSPCLSFYCVTTWPGYSHSFLLLGLLQWRHFSTLVCAFQTSVQLFTNKETEFNMDLFQFVYHSMSLFLNHFHIVQIYLVTSHDHVDSLLSNTLTFAS